MLLESAMAEASSAPPDEDALREFYAEQIGRAPEADEFETARQVTATAYRLLARERAMQEYLAWLRANADIRIEPRSSHSTGRASTWRSSSGQRSAPTSRTLRRAMRLVSRLKSTCDNALDPCRLPRRAPRPERRRGVSATPGGGLDRAAGLPDDLELTIRLDLSDHDGL